VLDAILQKQQPPMPQKENKTPNSIILRASARSKTPRQQLAENDQASKDEMIANANQRLYYGRLKQSRPTTPTLQQKPQVEQLSTNMFNP